MPEQHMPGRPKGYHHRRASEFLLRNVLHADDPPHRLALGIAIGMFVTFLPIVGVQMVVVVFLASLLRANRVVGVPIVWISNPVTMVPIFYACYELGRSMLGHEAIGRKWWVELRSPPPGWWESTAFYYTRLIEIAWPLWTGCLLVGVVTAGLAYVVTYRAVSNYRARRAALRDPDRLA